LDGNTEFGLPLGKNLKIHATISLDSAKKAQIPVEHLIHGPPKHTVRFPVKIKIKIESLYKPSVVLTTGGFDFLG
jgi:hypothetical protein